jgi:hypothetical protein
MAGLLDIVPASASVDVGGVSVAVSGVSVKGIASLLARFPEIQGAMTGEGITADKIIALAPDAVAAIIAAGCGAPGNADHEAARKWTFCLPSSPRRFLAVSALWSIRSRLFREASA